MADVDQLLDRLREMRGLDPEYLHPEADKIMLELVREYVPRGAEIAAEYEILEKRFWYA